MDHHERMKEYYERRAHEYDDAYLGRGVYADRGPSVEQLEALGLALSGLPSVRVLDVGCGTGFLTRYLGGEVVGLDQSDTMLEAARRRIPRAEFLRGDALELPFADGAFDRVFASNLYGLLGAPERGRFLAEARRVAPELVVVEPTPELSEGGRPEGWEERRLADGSRHAVYRRYFEADELTRELRGRVLFAGTRFVMVAAAV